MALFEVHDLDVAVRRQDHWKTVVNGTSFHVDTGEVLALVGESGAGKSLMAMGSLNLCRAGSKPTGGKVFFDGVNLAELEDADRRLLVGTGIGALFQDPIGSFDPLEMIGSQSGEVLEEHFGLSQEEIQQRVLDALGEVQLPKRRGFLSFSFQMSRGQAQRAMLAAVLLSSPRLLVADEPVTGLDATVARAVLSLIEDLRSRRGMAMILITHDLGVVAGMADRIAVVYGGSIVETGTAEQIFKAPVHPYTEGLLGSIPWPDSRRLRPIEGSAPDISDLPLGCSFAPRCPYIITRCLLERPDAREVGDALVRCFRANELELRGVGA